MTGAYIVNRDSGARSHFFQTKQEMIVENHITNPVEIQMLMQFRC